VLQAGAVGQAAWVKAGTVVLHGEGDPAVGTGQAHPDRGAARVLAGILQGLDAAEVDGSLGVGRIPADTAGLKLHPAECFPGLGGHRRHQPLVGKQRRVDAAGQLP